MTDLHNAKKIILEIAQLLSSNETVCKLVYNDSANALHEKYDGPTNLDDLINQGYISPYMPVEENFEKSTHNSFIGILLEKFFIDGMNGDLRGSISICISCDGNHVLLQNNKNRLIELADAIIRTLNKTKLSAATELKFVRGAYYSLSPSRGSYSLSFDFADHGNVKAEI